MQKLLTALIVTFSLLACTQPNPIKTIAIDTDIIKSPNDQRSYGAITLDNQLQILLVSDPTTDKSAASMDVYVGSADDPKEFEGLAHFLEHMLFLGTEKYPDADEYQKYISEHGGQHNAYTSLAHTNYFFDINAEHFEGALDRFSQQFTSPLFNEEYVSREVKAVNSEYSSKLKDDGRRFFSAVKTILAKDHPYQKFSVGNLETLKDSDTTSLRDALLEFYTAHYSANTMRLVLLGKESLPELAAWAKAKFANIKNHNLAAPRITQELFDENFLPAQLEVQSIMDKRSMAVAFPIPSPTEYRDSQPVSYLANLIGHEGKGSLLSTLKTEQLVDSLSAGAQFDTRTDAMFMVNMSLTQKGLANTNRILEILFAYIDLIKKDGLKKLYFDEQAQMNKISFAYQEKVKPMSLTRGLAGQLQEISAHRVLFEGYDLSLYDPELYLGFANHLRPDNMLITLNAKTIEGEQETRWYKASYNVKKIDDETVALLSKSTPVAGLALPEKNVFIPENVSLIEEPAREHPVKLIGKPGIELWHENNTSFGTPKANLFVTIRSPKAMQNAASLNLTEIMVALLKDSLNEYSYPAYLAGLHYELYNHMRGVTIKISGYNDKQLTLLTTILKTLKHADFKADRFEIIKERLKRSLENSKDKKPYEQSIAKAQRQILRPSWSPEQRLAALLPTTLKELNAFRNNFFTVLDTALLSSGNINEEMSRNIAAEVENSLLKGAEKQAVNRSDVVRLAGEKGWYNKVKVEHPDAGFIYYLQGKDTSHEEQAKFLLLSQILSSDYYAKIRTDMQLGYIVFATNFKLLEVPGIAFIVQSPNTSGPTLFDETQSFLAQHGDVLKALEDEAFERYKASVISRLTEKDNTLYAKSNIYWQEIDRKNANFDTKEQLVKQIESLSKSEFMAFYQALISDSGRSLLVYSEPPIPATDETKEQEKTKNTTPKGLEVLTDNARQELEHFPL